MTKTTGGVIWSEDCRSVLAAELASFDFSQPISDLLSALMQHIDDCQNFGTLPPEKQREVAAKVCFEVYDKLLTAGPLKQAPFATPVYELVAALDDLGNGSKGAILDSSMKEGGSFGAGARPANPHKDQKRNVAAAVAVLILENRGEPNPEAVTAARFASAGVPTSKGGKITVRTISGWKRKALSNPEEEIKIRAQVDGFVTRISRQEITAVAILRDLARQAAKA